jgi:lipoate-protein ligase A
MARLDVQEYREKYLKLVEERLTAKKDQVPHFTTQNLHEALMTEMNRADEETWEVEVPDDIDEALKEAEKRMLETMKHNIDLGTGKSF